MISIRKFLSQKISLTQAIRSICISFQIFQAVRHLLALQDDVTIKVEYAAADFERIRNGPLGDNFYIRFVLKLYFLS